MTLSIIAATEWIAGMKKGLCVFCLPTTEKYEPAGLHKILSHNSKTTSLAAKIVAKIKGVKLYREITKADGCLVN